MVEDNSTPQGDHHAQEVTTAEPSAANHHLEDTYWRYLLTKGQRPKSVFTFAEYANIPEADFYKTAANFDALESNYWERLAAETVEVLHADDDYAGYSAEDKLLAFYYTFFAHTQKNRSRLVEYFPKFGPPCSKLKGIRRVFTRYAKGIIAQGIQEDTIADRKKLTEAYPMLMFDQFRGIIEFHRRDSSLEFQDTDAFIEKTVRLSSNLARGGTVESLIDLGRFLLRRVTT